MKAYTLFFNITLEPDSFLKNSMTPAPVDISLLRLKISIDNGLLKYFKGKDASEIEVTFSNYPMPFDRFLSGFNIISLAGTLFFFFIPMVTFIIILIKVTKEKELQIRLVSY
jgi:hypothetical protein